MKTSTEEFKREALALWKSSGKPLAQIARELGLSDNTMHGWKRQLEQHGEDAFPGSGHQTPMARGKPTAAKRTRTDPPGARHPKKGSCHLFAPSVKRYEFIDAHKSSYPVKCLCQTMQVAVSGYDAWSRRETSAHRREDGQLKHQIQTIFQAHAHRYGSPRIHAE